MGKIEDQRNFKNSRGRGNNRGGQNNRGGRHFSRGQQHHRGGKNYSGSRNPQFNSNRNQNPFRQNESGNSHDDSQANNQTPQPGIATPWTKFKDETQEKPRDLISVRPNPKTKDPSEIKSRMDEKRNETTKWESFTDYEEQKPQNPYRRIIAPARLPNTKTINCLDLTFRQKNTVRRAITACSIRGSAMTLKMAVNNMKRRAELNEAFEKRQKY